MEVDAQVVAVHIGIERWCTPSFAGARADAERARKTKGPYGVEAGMTVTIPAIGKAAPVVYAVAKTEDGDLVFRSEYDKPTTGLDAFQRKFKHEGYPELPMTVKRADSTSFDALPVEAGFTCERIEFRDTEEGVKWRRVVEMEEEEAEEAAEAQAEEEAEEGEEADEAADEAPVLCSKSNACSRPNGHSGKCNSRRAAVEEAVEAFDTAPLTQADLMVLAIDAGCSTRESIRMLLEELDGRDMHACFGAGQASRYRDLWTCTGRGVGSEYALTEDGSSKVAELKETHGAALEAAVQAAVAAAGEAEAVVPAPAKAAVPSSRISRSTATPSVASSSAATPKPVKAAGGSKALSKAAAAASVVLEASAVDTLDERAQLLVAKMESKGSEAYRKCKFDKFSELSADVAEEDDAGQARCMKEARAFAEAQQLPDDPELVNLRAARERVQTAKRARVEAQARLDAAQAEADAAEEALTSLVEDPAPPAKKAKK